MVINSNSSDGSDCKLVHTPPVSVYQQAIVGVNASSEQTMAVVKTQVIKGQERDFSGGAVIENLPANAGDTGSSPGLGGSHMPRSSWACEPQLLSLRVWSLCSATREAAIVRGPRTAMKSGPRSPPTRESPCTETRTQRSQK